MKWRERKKHSNNNSVRITYYVESPNNIRSYAKIKPHPFARKSQTTRKKCGGGCYYDRRAQLLAYANHVREADPETFQWSRKCQSSKQKWKWTPTTPARILTVFCRIFFRGTRGRWEYEPMVSEENIYGSKKKLKKKMKKKKNSPGRSISRFCNKLKSMLKEAVSFGVKCSKVQKRR